MNTAAATTAAAPAAAKTQEQIAREVSKNLATAIAQDFSSENTQRLSASMHAHFEKIAEKKGDEYLFEIACDAKNTLDHFYYLAKTRHPHPLNNVLFLDNKTGKIWIQRMQAGEAHPFEAEKYASQEKYISRISEYDSGFLTDKGQTIWINGESTKLPRSKTEFRQIFAARIAEAAVKNLNA